MKGIRVLSVCRTATGRDLHRRALSGVADVEFLGAAPSCEIALMQSRDLRPDVIIADSSLTDCALSGFVGKCADLCGASVLVAMDAGAPATEVTAALEALEHGAVDLVMTPESADGVTHFQQHLLSRIRACSIKRYSALALGRPVTPVRPDSSTHPPTVTAIANPRALIHGGRFELVVVGVSTGGPEALTRLIPALPPSLPVPVVIVIHMPAQFTGPMASSLARKSLVPVKEAVSGEVLQRGRVYLAPGGKHLKVLRSTGSRLVLETSEGPAENGCKPSVDVLFRSAAEATGGKTAALILTGMGLDGVKGLAVLKEKGAYVIAQDESSSVVWGMPGAAVERGFADAVLGIDQIAVALTGLVSK